MSTKRQRTGSGRAIAERRRTTRSLERATQSPHGISSATGTLSTAPGKHRKKQGRLPPKQKPPTPPVNPLVLTACDWEPGTTITLTFDRAIDISEMDGSQIQVVDGTGTGFVYVASGDAEIVGGTTIVIALNVIEASFDPGPRLDATAASGIVASDDGGAWAGIENAPIPL